MSEPIALVMAGGGGTRLWPASRPDRPKQLLDPFLRADGSSLVAATIERLNGLIEQERIFVVTERDQVESLRLALPTVHPDRFIVEPWGRNTAPCVALGLRAIRASLGSEVDDTVLLALPADHHVGQADRLRAHLAAACRHAREADTIVTLGIAPNRPATGYGYIEREAEPLVPPGADRIAVYKARRFVEKPDSRQAEEFLQSGRFLWNAGIFAMSFTRIEREFERHCPNLWNKLGLVEDARRIGDRRAIEEIVTRAYAQVDSVPIDKAVMEKVDDLRVIPAEVGWADLGTWRAIFESLPHLENGNVEATGPTARTIVLDSTNSLVWAEDGTVAVIGLEHVAVIASGGSFLVCPLDRVEEVRAVVERLRTDS